MSKAKRLRELEAENVFLKKEIERFKKKIIFMQNKSSKTIGSVVREDF